MPDLFRHRFESVADYLHHRPPYLLIDAVTEIADDSIETTTTVAEDAFFIQGHFPGAHVLPGAIMQEMTTQSAGILIAGNFNPMETYNTHDPDFNEFALGVLVKVKFGRYRGFARPGDQLSISIKLDENVDQVFDFSGKIVCKGKTIYRNQFQLTNMRSDMLRG
ncbi:3-hydroxyacyl-[acyl-carrier-protein] dehydratase FabZ [Rubripirellula obstinata]|uniref:3-hydroxyacyl-[acyl-carrier-protein] dehydratase FabZ n=1 Tax=Rubripirellula obstinata TaxID=406547 RepID=A0A5B1C933_9BACT|nr:hypothetical protein [Rubripirellula obstinata]KAA1257637.1 3-hydroxyacyl-[acyl-carrier-protein] dehydratase FabZ [Rubripirellula obstinata]